MHGWMRSASTGASLRSRQDVTVFYNDPDMTGDGTGRWRIGCCLITIHCWHEGQTPVELSPGETLLLEDIEPEETTNLTLGQNCVLVPDEMAEQLDIRRQVWAVNYAGDPEKVEAQLVPLLQNWNSRSSLTQWKVVCLSIRI